MKLELKKLTLTVPQLCAFLCLHKGFEYCSLNNSLWQDFRTHYPHIATVVSRDEYREYGLQPSESTEKGTWFLFREKILWEDYSDSKITFHKNHEHVEVLIKDSKLRYGLAEVRRILAEVSELKEVQPEDLPLYFSKYRKCYMNAYTYAWFRKNRRDWIEIETFVEKLKMGIQGTIKNCEIITTRSVVPHKMVFMGERENFVVNFDIGKL